LKRLFAVVKNWDRAVGSLLRIAEVRAKPAQPAVKVAIKKVSR
jgi:hypothetical protein